MATVTLSQPLYECLKTMFWFRGNGKKNMRKAAHPRVLFPSDIFFDDDTRLALHFLQQQRNQQMQREELPPMLESTSSEESSVDSFFDEDTDESNIYNCATRPLTHANCLRKALDSLKHSGNNNCLTLTLMGSKGVNQDASMVVHPLLPMSRIPTLLLGVFDGHATLGEHVAGHCREHLERGITSDLHALMCSSPRNLRDHEAIAHRLSSMVEAADRSIPEDIAAKGGSTVSMVLQVDRNVYLANTGDSQSAICAYIPSTNECVILETTIRHTLEAPQERERILRCGARIEDGYVIYNVSAKEECGVGMTRALGDRLAPGVIATPAVTTLSVVELKNRARSHSRNKDHLKKKDIALFGFCVSDGVLDVASIEEIAPSLAQAFTQDCSKAPTMAQPMLEVNFWIQECAERWKSLTGGYRDDITIAAAKLL